MTSCRTAVLLFIIAVTCLPVVLVSARRVRGGSAASQKRKLSDLPVSGNLFQHRTVDVGFPGEVLDDKATADEVASNTAWKRVGVAVGKTGATDEDAWVWKAQDCKSGKKSGKGSNTAAPTPIDTDPTASSSPQSSKGKGSGKGSPKSAICEDEDETDTKIPDGVETDIPDGVETDIPDGVETDVPDGGTQTDSPQTPAPDGADICALINAQSQPATLENNLVSFDAFLSITYDTTSEFNSPEKVLEILGFLEKPVALWCAGCKDLANTYLARRRRSLLQRKLADEIDYAELSDFTQVGACSTAPSDPFACTEFKTEVKVWSNVEAEVLRARAIEAFERFAVKLVENDGIEGAADFGLTSSDQDSGQGGDTNGAVRSINNVEDEGLNAGGAVGIAAGCLAMLLLLVLLVKRRRDSDEVSHLKLEEDAEATFIRELDSASQPSNEHNPRNAHVVGEEDSIYSGWTGYPPKDVVFDDDVSEGVEGILGQRHGDVHACSSATCEVCEQKRRQGLQFLPTGSPPRPQGLPSDAARDYVAEDTVEL